MSVRVSGTEGYAEAAAAMLARPLSFAEVHKPVLHLMPKQPCRALDIGAGTGHDAADLAAMGHSVVAVEPTEALRVPAMALHPSPAIEWIDDSLPELSALATRAANFDLVLLTAVWMHLDAGQRRRAMQNVAALLRAGGLMIMSLRHGPVPEGRRMFEVSGDETIGLAAAQALTLLLQQRADSVQEHNRRAGVTWTWLAFAKA
jgi:SAM-dependent methyltransferase